MMTLLPAIDQNVDARFLQKVRETVWTGLSAERETERKKERERERERERGAGTLIVIIQRVEPGFVSAGTRRCYFPLLSVELGSAS